MHAQLWIHSSLLRKQGRDGHSTEPWRVWRHCRKWRVCRTLLTLRSVDESSGNDPHLFLFVAWSMSFSELRYRMHKPIQVRMFADPLCAHLFQYSGWSANNKEMYYPAPIVFKMQNRKETIVEFLRDAIKEWVCMYLCTIFYHYTVLSVYSSWNT